MTHDTFIVTSPGTFLELDWSAPWFITQALEKRQLEERQSWVEVGIWVQSMSITVLLANLCKFNECFKDGCVHADDFVDTSTRGRHVAPQTPSNIFGWLQLLHRNCWKIHHKRTRESQSQTSAISDLFADSNHLEPMRSSRGADKQRQYYSCCLLLPMPQNQRCFFFALHGWKLAFSENEKNSRELLTAPHT